MSGAGMSSCGPMNGASSAVKRRVMRASSPCESMRGLQRTPPFAPPYGRRSNAHFHVIHIASAAHSPRSTLVVVADTALRRPEHRRVLDAIGGERRVAAVVQPHRERQDRPPARDGGAARRRSRARRRAPAPARAGSAPAGRAACPTRAVRPRAAPPPRPGGYVNRSFDADSGRPDSGAEAAAPRPHSRACRNRVPALTVAAGPGRRPTPRSTLPSA